MLVYQSVYSVHIFAMEHTPFLVIWKALKPKRSSKMWWTEDDRNLDTPNSLTPFQSPASQYSSNHWPLHNIVSMYINVYDSTLWGTGFFGIKILCDLSSCQSTHLQVSENITAFVSHDQPAVCMARKRSRVDKVLQRTGTPCIWACSTLVFSGNLTSWHYQKYIFPARTGLTFFGFPANNILVQNI